MNIHKVSEIFIAKGAGLDTDTTAVGSITKQFNFLSADNTVVQGGSVTPSTDPTIYALNELANGDLKRSFPIKATNIVSMTGAKYAPATRCVRAIGYSRSGATGTIEVNSSTQYTGTIVFKSDKLLFSERQETLRFQFTSAANATKSSIADQIVGAINATAYATGATKVIKAVKVGNQTGVYGVTNATEFGVEIWGLDVEQFNATSYKEVIVQFEVFLDSNSGFGATTKTNVQSADHGVGTYRSIYNLEKYNYQYEGVLNRRLFPVPELAYLASSTGVTSDTLAAFTVTGTIAEDKVTFSAASNVELPAGSIVLLDGVQYEIKYYISSTVAILTTVLSAGLAADAVKGKAWYDVINITIDDTVSTPGANVSAVSKKHIVVAVEAIETSDDDMENKSTTSSDLETLLNAWSPVGTLAL